MEAPQFAFLLVLILFSFDCAHGKRWLRIESVNDMISEEDGLSPFYTQTSLKRRWPDKTVIYDFDSTNCDFNETQKASVISAMQIISNATCIKFKKRTTETAYVNIQNLVKPDNCNSLVGYTGKKQAMNIALWCLERQYSLAHEFIHALGFHHEQTRYDRDMYVELLWDNISQAKRKNYNKYPRTYAYPKYNYNLLSMMHYSVGSSTSNRPAMVLNSVFNITTEPSEVGQRVRLSNTDIWRITSAYRCDSTNGEVRSLHSDLTEGQIYVADVTFY